MGFVLGRVSGRRTGGFVEGGEDIWDGHATIWDGRETGRGGFWGPGDGRQGSGRGKGERGTTIVEREVGDSVDGGAASLLGEFVVDEEVWHLAFSAVCYGMTTHGGVIL